MSRWRCHACGRLLCDHRVSQEPPRAVAKPPAKADPSPVDERRVVKLDERRRAS